MKKIINLVLAVSVAASATVLSSCGNRNAKTGAGTNSGTTAVTPAQDAATVAKSARDKLASLDSFHLDGDSEISISVNGEAQEVETKIESDIDCKNGLASMKTDMLGTSVEIYCKDNGSTCDMYVGTLGSWVRQTIDSEQIYKLGGSMDGSDQLDFYLKTIDIDNMDETTKNGKNVYLISGSIGSNNMDEAIEKAGLSTMFEQMELDEDSIADLLSGLSSIELSIAVEKDTFLPVSLELDMTDMLSDLYAKLSDIAAEAGEDVEFTVETAVSTVTYSNYDSIDEIVIPDDALNAPETEIIQ